MTNRIQMLHHFSGKESKEREIAPGEYSADDPALYGLARYLVENGHAVEIETEAEVIEVEDVDGVAAVYAFPSDAAPILDEIERIEAEQDAVPQTKPKPKGKR